MMAEVHSTFHYFKKNSSVQCGLIGDSSAIQKHLLHCDVFSLHVY
jgi:hypothetical protein